MPTLTSAERYNILKIASQRRSATFWDAGGLNLPPSELASRFFKNISNGTTGLSLGFSTQENYISRVNQLLNTTVGRYSVDRADSARAQYLFGKVDAALTPLIQKTIDTKIDYAGILHENTVEGRQAYFTIMAVFNRTENAAFLREIANIDHPLTLADINVIAKKYETRDQDLANYAQGAAAVGSQGMGWIPTPTGYKYVTSFTSEGLNAFVQHIFFDVDKGGREVQISPSRLLMS